MTESAINASVNLNFSEIITVSNTHIEFISENFFNYLLFNFCFILFYTNKQFCYY